MSRITTHVLDTAAGPNVPDQGPRPAVHRVDAQELERPAPLDPFEQVLDGRVAPGVLLGVPLELGVVLRRALEIAHGLVEDTRQVE